MTEEEKVRSVHRYEHCGAYGPVGPEDYTVEVVFRDEKPIQVQLTGCDHKSDCLILVDGYEYEGDPDTPVMVEAVRLAEKFSRDECRKLTRKDLGFNVSLNDVSWFMRVDPEEGTAEIMAEAHQRLLYRADLESLKSFETEEKAWEFVNQFRTGKHHDADGLTRMLAAIRESGDVG